MFWGLQLEANLRYSQQVPEGFRITKATLSTETPPAVARSQDSASKLVQVFVDQDGSDYAIATLKHGEIFDCSMDLRFAEGEDICFYLKGEGIVFLTGHNLYPEDPNDEAFIPRSALLDASSSDELDSEDDDDDEEGDDDGPEIEDITEAAIKAKRNSIKASNGVVAIKKENASQVQKLVAGDEDDDDDLDSEDEDDSADEDDLADEDDSEDEEDDDDDDESDDSDEQEDNVKGKTAPGLKRSDVAAQLKSKAPEPKKAKLQNGIPIKRANGDVKRVSDAAKTSQGAKTAPASLTNESVKELMIEDLTVGSGPVAKKGRTIKVYYTGKLLNGKVFDHQRKGDPFQFKLGTSSVIKGWDRGLEGMRVGGKRRLIIPANLAYGKQSMGPIPSGSALKFDVELKAVE